MRCSFASTFVLVAMLSPWAFGQLEVVPRKSGNSYFGGRKVTLHYSTDSPARTNDRVQWAVVVRDQVIARREARLTSRGSEPAQFAIELDLPDARSGIALPLSVVISINGQKAHHRKLWVFPEDAFAEKRKSLGLRKIVLFDPEGNTAAVFERSEIPFALQRNIDVLATISQGTLVIGEGVSFRDYRGLGDIMVNAAARGVHVICLAPDGGTISFPGTDQSDLPQPDRLLLSRTDVIRHFDERFDSTYWSPDGEVVSSSVLVTGERNGVTGVVTSDARGWPWIDVRFAGSGRMVICGFAIIEKWDASPTPRYFLVHLLNPVMDSANLTNEPPVDPSVKGPSR